MSMYVVVINAYIVEVQSVDGRKCRIALSSGTVEDDDISELGTLTDKGKDRFGLRQSDMATVVKMDTFEIIPDRGIAIDTDKRRWWFNEGLRHWVELREEVNTVE